MGTASGTISDNLSSATVKFTLANSVMKVTNTIPEHYTTAANNPVKISLVNDDSKNVSAPIDTYVFVPYDETLKIDVTGKSTAGVDKYFSCTMTSATEACKAYNVQIADEGASMYEVCLSDDYQVAWGDMIVITTPATFKGISSANQNAVVYEAIPVPSEGAEADWNNAKQAASNGVISGLTPGISYYVRARVGGVTSLPITLTPAVTGLSASAAHTDTNGVAEGGDLDGTDVVATFESPHDKVTEAISSWSFVVCKSTDENTALRTFNFAEGTVSGTVNSDGSDLTVNSDGSDLTGANDWPYLPQGDYTLIATATMENGTKVSSKTPIKVPAPTFGVSVSANTTYSYYTKQGASVANGKVAETIYDIASSVGISQNILDNTNYSRPVVTYSVGSTHSSGEKEYTALNSHSLGSNFEGLAWGTHDLKASIKFDNTTVSGTCVCYITGLPYKSPDFTTQSPELTNSNEANKWISQGTTSYNEDRGFQIYYFYNYLFGETSSSGNVFSPAFQIPQNQSVNISYVVGINFYTSGIGTGQTVDIYTGPTNNLEKVTTKTTTVSRGESYSNKITNITSDQDSAVLNTRISISHNDPSLRNNRAENWVLITGLQVNYR